MDDQDTAKPICWCWASCDAPMHPHSSLTWGQAPFQRLMPHAMLSGARQGGSTEPHLHLLRMLLLPVTKKSNCDTATDTSFLELNACLQGNLVHIQEAVPSREHFLLPALGPKLEKLGEEVRIGRGFQLLR